MIEIKEYQDEPYLVFNQIIMGRDKINLEPSSVELLFRILDEEVTSEIRKTPFNKFDIKHESKDVTIYFLSPLNIDGITQTVDLSAFADPEKSFFELAIDFYFEFDQWSNLFSPEELVFKIEKVANRNHDIEMRCRIDDEGYEITFTCDYEQNIDNYLHIANGITRDAVNQLIIENNKDPLTSIFDFPESIRVPCEQYLIYFAEFLNNLGIKATTEITHQASNVLFTVVPESKNIALEHIQEALAIYLQLPSQINDMGYINLPNDPQIQQLFANVQHFKSQIMLLNATIQMQSQTIDQQQTIINQQKSMLDTTILQTSLVAKNEEDKEELFGGMMALTKLEVKGVVFNFANIYRWIKSHLKRN
ncbi:hypothetical protein [Priestia megaterium]|uniref:hypothetical protein n=1 Tax=Priestia megaterium TaxID=1404 RepID=UPI0023DBD956|nr:hypothetical protein [Priestia megaterium]MDF2011301.1 hypothetical protein [Priestia megaterium]